MLNDARINAQKTPLGFLNPFLYSIGYNALNDITAGNNPGCGTPGFNVGHICTLSSHITNAIPVCRPLLDGILVSSWRSYVRHVYMLTIPVVTGYGTPNFEKLKDLVLAMP